MDKRVSLARSLTGILSIEELTIQLGDIFSRIEDYLSGQVNVYWFPNPNRPLPAMNAGDLVFTVINGVVTLQQWDGTRLSPISVAGPAGKDGEQGIQGETSPPAPSASIFPYRVDANDQAISDPGAGKIRFNTEVQQEATSIVFDWLTSDGFDAHIFFKLTPPASKILIQDVDTAGTYQVWKVVAVHESTDWFYIDVVFDSQSGPGGVCTFNHNQNVAVIIQFVGETGAAGVGIPAGGSTGHVLAKNTPTDYDAAWVNPEKLFPAGSFHEVMSSGLPDPEVVFDGVTGDVMLGYRD